MARKYVAVGPWGGESGDSWIFTAEEGDISKMTLTYSTAISSIFLESWKFGQEESSLHTDKFGKAHQSDKEVEIVFNGERLMGISGTIGKLEDTTVVTSLSISTDKRDHIGPFGSTTGEAFSLAVEEGTVVGFHGSISGLWINSIGSYLRNDRHFKIEAWGGPGGDVFSYMLQGALSHISITHDDIIHSIIFTSKDSNGDTHVSPQFGNKVGRTRDEIEIDTTKEAINGISGSYGEFVSSLCFHTTSGNKIGPFGRPTGTPFYLPIKDGVIEGFHGHSGWYLDAIGIYLNSTA